MIKNAIARLLGAGLLAAAASTFLSASAQAQEYYPAPESLESSQTLQWQAGPIVATASTNLSEITVTTNVPAFRRIGHSIDIQMYCAHDTFISLSPDSNYFTRNGDVTLACPDGNVVKKADVVVILQD